MKGASARKKGPSDFWLTPTFSLQLTSNFAWQESIQALFDQYRCTSSVKVQGIQFNIQLGLIVLLFIK